MTNRLRLLSYYLHTSSFFRPDSGTSVVVDVSIKGNDSQYFSQPLLDALKQGHIGPLTVDTESIFREFCYDFMFCLIRACNSEKWSPLVHV